MTRPLKMKATLGNKSGQPAVQPVWLSTLIMVAALLLGRPLVAQEVDQEVAKPVVPPPAGTWPLKLPPSLKQVPVPVHADLLSLIRDRGAAIQVGKALFWDMQVGSDERTACATCHHHAGADSRWRGTWRQDDRTVVPEFADRLPELPLSGEADAVLGSPGVHARPHGRRSAKAQETDRQVTGRNSPSVINSIFNHRNFWDGRANAVFNGRTPFGLRDSDAEVYWADSSQSVRRIAMGLTNASLASQAVGPVLNSVEMSFAGRSWPDVGRRLLGRRALELQRVAPDDSVLAPLASNPARNGRHTGLTNSYRELIQRAFVPALWQFQPPVAVAAGDTAQGANPSPTPGNWQQDELNFSLFFGVSVLLYEATLVSDETPFDRFLEGQDSALDAAQRRGMELFYGPANCGGCHRGPEMTAAGLTTVLREWPARKAGRTVQSQFPVVDVVPGATDPAAELPEAVAVEAAEIELDGGAERPEQALERMLNRAGQIVFYDAGFYNLGVSASRLDSGVAGSDPWGGPLSFSTQFQRGLAGIRTLDHFEIRPLEFTFPLALNYSRQPVLSAQSAAKLPVGVQGAFKTPGLRNVELTGPYFHNGSAATLEQVVDFYNQGGNFDARQEPSLHIDMEPLGLSASQRSDLVAFLRSLTDERVRWEQAPFDHPSLLLPHGVQRASNGAIKKESRLSINRDRWEYVTATGRGGSDTPLAEIKAIAAPQPAAASLPLAAN
jgi:cytochrome c peroxidase